MATPGPTPGVDLWWSGKHTNHGGNIQVITAPDGRPIWTSEVRLGREHDTTAVRTHTEILPALNGVRAIAERGNALLKGTFKVEPRILRPSILTGRVSGCLRIALTR